MWSTGAWPPVRLYGRFAYNASRIDTELYRYFAWGASLSPSHGPLIIRIRIFRADQRECERLGISRRDARRNASARPTIFNRSLLAISRDVYHSPPPPPLPRYPPFSTLTACAHAESTRVVVKEKGGKKGKEKRDTRVRAREAAIIQAALS